MEPEEKPVVPVPVKGVVEQVAVAAVGGVAAAAVGAIVGKVQSPAPPKPAPED